MTAQMFDLAIIIPNFKTIDFLNGCIASIYEHTKGLSSRLSASTTDLQVATLI
jgi:hypothetical protein